MNNQLTPLLLSIKKQDRKFYNFLVNRLQLEKQLGETVDVSTESASIFDKIANLATTYYQTRQQRDIIKMQTDRAKQGLPPADVSQYGAPPVRVEVGAPSIIESLKPMLPIVGVGLIALKLLK